MARGKSHAPGTKAKFDAHAKEILDRLEDMMDNADPKYTHAITDLMEMLQEDVREPSVVRNARDRLGTPSASPPRGREMSPGPGSPTPRPAPPIGPITAKTGTRTLTTVPKEDAAMRKRFEDRKKKKFNKKREKYIAHLDEKIQRHIDY
jgi:hypothetical protein